MKRFCLLGASRGLGWGTYLALSQKYPDAHFLLVSRKIANQVGELKANTQVLTFDFSKSTAADLLPEVQNFSPTEIIYCAGGGPYANFFESSWESHLWSLKVTFLFPMEFILKLGQSYKQNRDQWTRTDSSLQSITVIGSSIAESSPDPMAASYCAAKHALKGLISTLQKENSSQIQIKMFSPGYIATDLLPKNSAPRMDGRAQSVEAVASELINFIE